MMQTADWMTVFLITTLASWMAAGVMAIFGVHEEVRHPAATQVAERLMAGFMFIGATSIICVIVASVIS
jgi:hypothetical protein